MSCLKKILGVIVASLLMVHTVQSSPIFQGFSVQKGFEVKFKPLELKPLAFFKEAWSPFGTFGVRKGIQKRDLIAKTKENLPPRPEIVSPAPVFEIPEEKIESRREEELKEYILKLNELKPGPDPIKPISSNLIRIPLERVKSSTELFTRIGSPPIVITPKPITPKPIEAVQIFGELPPRPIGPVPEPVPVSPNPILPISRVPFQPVTPNVVPLRPPSFIEPRPAIPFFFQPINAELGQVAVSPVPFITSPPPPSSPVPVTPEVSLSEIPPTEGPLVRGSRVALYFGNVFLQLFSQFLTNARKKITQFKQSSTVPPMPTPSGE